MQKAKKTLNLIALIVFLMSNFLTPISYAVDDDLDAYNNPGSEQMTDQDGNNEQNKNGVEPGLNGGENPQNDGLNVDNNPGSESMTDQDGNSEQNENGVEPRLSGGEGQSTKDSLAMPQNDSEQTVDSPIVPQNDENDNEEKSSIGLLNDIIGENEELAGEVEKTELDIAREILNQELIEDSKTYNNVTVNVKAFSGTFPEGTKLNITSIKKQSELNEIKQQIVDSDASNNIDEDTEIVAFDISFIYALSDGEEIEVQPKDGESVQVTFDYSRNKDLKAADKDDSQQIEIYHINDKDENGEKVEKGEEVVEKIEINQEKSEEIDDALVIDAESFSTYAVIVNGVSHTVVYGETEYTATLTGYNSTMDNFIYKTLTVGGYTIMDRNLGATAPMGEDTDPASVTASSASVGFHYQWGRDFGTDPADTTIDIRQFALGGYNRGQGPCPEGWHIPSPSEWNGLYNALQAGTDGTNMGILLKMPFAGYRYYNDDVVYDMGVGGYYWSSTRYNDGTASEFMISSSNIYSSKGSYYNGGSVRCFRDTPDYTLTLVPNNEESNITVGVYGNTVDEGDIPTVTKDGYTLVGWYTSDDGGQTLSDTAFDFDTAITEDITLYAKWNVDCSNGLRPNGNGTSCINADGIYSLMDGDVSVNMVINGDTNIIIMSDDVSNSCPSGYHIPSKSEWENLLVSWCSVTDICNARSSSVQSGGVYGDITEGGSSLSYKNELLTQFETDFSMVNGVYHSSTTYTYNPKPETTSTGRYGLLLGRFQTTAFIVKYYFGIGTTGDGVDNKKRCFRNSTISEISYYVVNFVANLTGVDNPSSKTVAYNLQYGTLPTVSKVGYNFEGWYDGEDKVTASTLYTKNEDTLLTAHWTCDGEHGYIDVNGKCLSPVEITYAPNGGAFSGKAVDATTVVTYTPGETYTPDINIQFPNKESDNMAVQSGWMFDGWYTTSVLAEQTSATEWLGFVDENTESQTVYAKWLPFDDLPIEGTDYIIMDRNLGATSNDISDENSYGRYYQWGNNYGFDTTTSPWLYTGDTQVDASVYGPGNYYSSTIFILRSSSPYAWDTTDNDNLWGGATDTNESKQGPCPAGYHIPTNTEREDIYRSLGIESNELGVNTLQTKLKLPLAGTRSRTDSKIGYKEFRGYYLSSSRATVNHAYSLYFNSNSIEYKSKYDRSNAGSLRCLKDYHVVTFNSDGGTPIVSQQIEEGESAIQPNPAPTRANSTFDGWYIDRELTQPFNFSTIIVEDITLYAKWNCNKGTPILGDDGVRNCFYYEELPPIVGSDGTVYTLMDRNLGARVAWNPLVNAFDDNKASEYDTENDYYGYYYQHGNKYGFSNKTTSSSTNVIDEEITDVTENSTYYNVNWNKHQPWNSNTNLWGNVTDTEAARQGPCPADWHVPSYKEWSDIRKAWCSAYTGTENCSDGQQFAEALLLPTAGFRTNTLSFASRGTSGIYGCSTANSVNGTYGLRFSATAIEPSNYNARSNGLTIRCLKNTYEVTFDTNEGSAISSRKISIGGKVVEPTQPTKNGYIFVAWYKEPSQTNQWNFDTDTVTQDITLYAKWADSEKPECSISTQPTKTLISLVDGYNTGTVEFTCTDNVGISTSNLSSDAVDYNDTVVSLSNATVEGIDTNRTFTFTYSALAEGSTTFILKAGAVSDGVNSNLVTSVSDSVAVDATSPAITITQPNSSDWTKSKTVSATASDGTMYYSINTDGTCISATTLYTAGTIITFDSEDDNGKYVCFKAIDSVGNTEYERSAKIEKIDRTAPNEGTITINSDATYSTSQSVILTLDASDEGVGMGDMRFSCDNSNWSTWESYTTTKNWNLNTGDGCSAGDGEKTVYVQFRDALGNGTKNDNDSILLDTSAPTAPTCTANACYKTSQSVTCNASEGTIKYTTNGEDPTCSSATWENQSFSATTTLKVVACDAAGNVSSVSSYTYTADNAAPGVPTMTAEPEYTQGLSNAVTSSTVTDNGCNGNVQYQFCKSTTDSTTNCSDTNLSNWSSSTSATFTNLTDGQKYYYFVRTKDGLGNISEWSSSTSSTQDNSAPNISFENPVNQGPSIADDVVVNWDGATVKKWKYSDTDSCPTTSLSYDKTDSDSLNQTTEANNGKYICLYAEDALGNATQLASEYPINIDITAPTGGVFNINNNAEYTNSTAVILKTTCATDTGVGAVEVAYGNTTNPDNWTDCSSEINWTLTSGDGEKTVYMKFKDGLGNESAEITDTIILDTTAPTCKITGNPTSPTNSDVILTVDYLVEAHPLTAGYSWDNNTYSSTKTTTATSNRTYTAYVKDEAGNVGNCSETVTKIDKTAPEITINNPDTTPAQSKTITASKDKGTLYMTVREDNTCNNAIPSSNFVAYNSITFESENDNGKYVCYKAEDEAGNVTYKLSNQISGIDTTSPTITITQPNSSDWTLTKSVSATASDGTLYYSINTDGTCTSATTLYSTNITFESEDDNGKYVCFKAVDAAGNEKYERSAKMEKIDRTAPVLSERTPFNDGWYTSNQTSTFTYIDTGAGITEGQNTTVCTISTEGSTSTCEVTNTNVCDKLGNCNTADQTSYSIKLDKTQPECGTWTYQPTAQTNNNVTATLAGSTDATSGIKTVGGTCSLVSNDATCEVIIEDNAGLTRVCTSASVNNIDKVKPEATLQAETSTLKTGTQTARLICSDNVGVSSYYWGISNNPAPTDYQDITLQTNYNTTKTVNEAGTYYLFCRDEAGNVSDPATQSYYSYEVHNMLNEVDKAEGTYNATNYPQSTTATYIAPAGTTITFTNVYTVPNYSLASQYRGYTTSNSGNPSTNSSITLSSNSSYYCWFDRVKYPLTLTKGVGIQAIYYKVNGANAYTDTTVSTTVDMKAGSDAYVYAEASEGYTYNATSLTNPIEWTDVQSVQTFEPAATLNTYTVKFYDEDGTTVLDTQIVNHGENAVYGGETPSKTKTQQYTYTFSNWYDAKIGGNVDDLSNVVSDRDVYARYGVTVNKYTVTFVDEDGTVLKVATEYEYGTPAADIEKPADPSKSADEQNTYTFAGWTPEIVDVIGDATYKATYNATSKGSNYSGGGGKGRSTSPIDVVKESVDSNTDIHNAADEKTDTSSIDDKIGESSLEETGTENVNTVTSVVKGTETQVTIKTSVTSNNTKYTPEFNEAYSFAASNGITTKSDIEKAQMNTSLTRIQMAKMLSNYAINILGQRPDITKTIKFDDVSSKRNTEYDNGVTLAYQLGIMGINMKNNKFRPDDEVTRAEFVTALSRMIYGTKDGTGKMKYYEPHMIRMYNEGIINNTNPKMKEKRGYVMIMLMRTVK